MNPSGNPYETPQSKSGRPELPVDDLSEAQVDAAVRVSQTITAALVMGLLTFTAFSLVSMYQQKAAINWNFPPITIAGLGLAACAIPASFLIPKIISASSARGQTGDKPEVGIQSLIAKFQTQLVIGLAMLEGAGFLNSFALMREQNPTSLLGAILCVGMMLVRIPTRAKLQHWIAERLQG